MYTRIIPRLDIKGPNLVKGIHLEGLRVLGKPENFAKYYFEQGADELLYMDVVASLYERNSLHDFITRTAKEIFIPLAVGGGIRSIEDMQSIFRAGADKVSINTAAVRNPELVSKAANLFGSANLVVSIEAIRQPDGKYYAFTDNGREKTGLEVVSWAKQVESLGAGEIILTSVDREGTGEGFDLELIESVSSSVNVPVIAHGGAGKPEDLKLAAQIEGVTGLSIASMLHYQAIEQMDKNIQLEEGSSSFIKSGGSFQKVQKTTINEIKKYLQSQKILCRI
jgi:imidazole glycerol-phosphate synthase subunit HisF